MHDGSMEWLIAARRIAAVFVPYTAGYVSFSLARPLIEQAVGAEVMKALADIALAGLIAVAIVALTPSVLAGLREIVGERVTGPLRPVRDADPPASSSTRRS